MGKILTSEQIKTMFKKASDTYGVDQDLLEAVAKTESSFDPTAYSKAGAIGVMQVMPNTFAALEVGSNIWDAQTNINAGAKYLSQLLEKNNGDVEMALASYNAGSGNVAKYGKEKYAKYYTTVMANYHDLTGKSNADFLTLGGKKKSDVVSDNQSTNGDYTPKNSDGKLKWWGNIVVVVFAILVIVGAVAFLGLSVVSTGNNPVSRTVKKAVKKNDKRK